MATVLVMFKKIFVFLSIVIVLGVLVAGFFFSSLLNTGIVEGVNRFGPKLTQTKVTLSSANISLLGGKGSLEGLFIGNPEGFTGDRAFELGNVAVDLDVASVFSDTVVIHKIHILEPAISFERTRRGSNLQTLQKNIEAATGGGQVERTEPETTEPSDAPEPAAESAKKVIIEHLVVEGAVVDVVFLGQTFTLSLPTLEMKDIGKEQGGINQALAVAQFTQELIGSIVSAATEEVSDFGNIGREVGKQIEGVGEEAEKALDSFKQLF